MKLNPKAKVDRPLVVPGRPLWRQEAEWCKPKRLRTPLSPSNHFSASKAARDETSKPKQIARFRILKLPPRRQCQRQRPRVRNIFLENKLELFRFHKFQIVFHSLYRNNKFSEFMLRLIRLNLTQFPQNFWWFWSEIPRINYDSVPHKAEVVKPL